MNPIYRFTLSANGGAERAAFPVYRDDLAKDFELQTNQEFYRAKLSGKLTFVSDDYDFIVTQAFDTEFGVKIYISYDAGTTWTLYWSGNFWKTNCTFNADDKNVTLTPDVVDEYTDVLAGMEKEYNLIDLAPQIVPVNLDKRPMVQVYVAGQTSIGCFLSGMWWEQECDAVSDENQLINTYHFSKITQLRIAEISGSMSPQLPDVMTKENVISTLYEMSGGGYTLRYNEDNSDPDDSFTYYEIVRDSDNARLWYDRRSSGYEAPPRTIVLQPWGSGATGNVTVYIHDISVYCRVVCDVNEIAGQNTYEIGANDLVENNKNYSRVIGYNFIDTIFFSTTLVDTPTKWGLFQPGKYYQEPNSPLINEFYPVSRNAWGRVSIWFAETTLYWVVEQAGRQSYTLRDSYPLASVISVLLAQFAPNITHQETTDYSKFLYGVNPLLGITQRVLITPKSNMISLGYDQPAQKAPITLKQVLDMLRDCFRCYWFIDDQNRFCIEHISFFMNGGAYPGTPDYPVIGRYLTTETDPRNGKPLSFGTSKFQFDKPEMAARYQFGWMDDVTQLFEGNPLEIISKYVNPENIENVDISRFTSDVDYILLNPGEISKDGFVLLAAILSDGVYKLPYHNFILDDVDHRLQNAYVAFIWLQQYYFYDMPARHFKYNGYNMIATGIKKLKTQTLNFPVYTDPEDMMELIQTNLGNGTIQKMSVNLSSRNAKTTLKYDTE